MRNLIPALLCVSSWAYLDIPYFRDYDHVMEPFLFITCAAVSAIVLRKGRVYKGLTRSEAVLFLLWLLFVIRAGCCSGPPSVALPAAIVFLFFYLAFRIWALQTDPLVLQSVLYRTYFVLLSGYLFFFILSVLVMQHPVFSFSGPNSSLFGEELAVQLVLFITLSNRKRRAAGFWLLVAGSTIILIVMNGRAGWLGLTASMFFYGMLHLKSKKQKWIIIVASSMAIMLLFIVLLFYKRGSSEGRKLIYAVSLNMLRSHWATGAGPGNFAKLYNRAQADYFAEHDINGHDAQRAGNTIYAFNEFLQWWIEQGIAGFCLLLIFIVLLMVPSGNNRDPVSIAAISSLFCVVVTALFSYPLHFLPLILHSLLCVALIASANLREHTLSVSGSLVVRLSAFIVAVVVMIVFYKQASVRMQARAAFILTMNGNRSAALKIYATLENNPFTDGCTMFQYARTLWDAADTGSAIRVTNKAMALYTDADLLLLAASLYQAAGNYEQAEENYQKAVCILPSRMRSRYACFRFCLERGKIEKAGVWAKLILDQPVRVSIPYILKLKEAMRAFLDTNGQKQPKMP